VLRLNATLKELDPIATKMYLVRVLHNETDQTLIPDNSTHFNGSFFELNSFSMNPPYFPFQFYLKLIFTWGGRDITLTTHKRYLTGFIFQLNPRIYFYNC
jgi:hypothetical protein